MTAANRYLGNNWYGTFVYLAGTVPGTVTLSGDQTKFGMERTVDTVEVTAGSDTQKAYLATLTDNKFSYSVFDAGTAGTVLGNALKPNTSGTITFGPQGTATGKPQFQILALTISQKIEYPFDAAVMMDVEFLGSGAWIKDWGQAY